MAVINRVAQALAAGSKVDLTLEAGANSHTFVSLLRTRLPGRGKGLENLTIINEKDG